MKLNWNVSVNARISGDIVASIFVMPPFSLIDNVSIVMVKVTSAGEVKKILKQSHSF